MVGAGVSEELAMAVRDRYRITTIMFLIVHMLSSEASHLYTPLTQFRRPLYPFFNACYDICGKEAGGSREAIVLLLHARACRQPVGRPGLEGGSLSSYLWCERMNDNSSCRRKRVHRPHTGVLEKATIASR